MHLSVNWDSSKAGKATTHRGIIILEQKNYVLTIALPIVCMRISTT